MDITIAVFYVKTYFHTHILHFVVLRDRSAHAKFESQMQVSFASINIGYNFSVIVQTYLTVSVEVEWMFHVYHKKNLIVFIIFF